MPRSMRNGRWDPAAPFLVFLAGGVVVVLAVLAFLTYHEGRPRRFETMAFSGAAPITPISPAPNPQPLPLPTPSPPR